MTETPSAKHPLHESIGKHGIRRIAVVDDAFDTVSLESFQEGEDREFITAVNEEDVLLREYHKKVSGTESDELLQPADLTNEAVALLWEIKQTIEPRLRDVLDSTLFRVLDRKVSQVEILCSFLKDELGIERIEKYGTAAALPGDEFDIAFIDYRFGPSGEAASIERAVQWAKHLYSNGRTFIILMSADVEARGRQEYFREKSVLTRGLFEFLDKEEIEDRGKFFNRLNSFCAGLKTRHEIHGFATAAEAATDQALSALKNSIHALGLEDYAYLEQISLREDGHPLGDYMLWLFGEYFAHNLAVNDSLQAARKGVNAINYDRFLPLQRPPSVMLAKMYSAAITEPVYEGWGPHPRVVQEEQEEALRHRTEALRAEVAPSAETPPAGEPPAGGPEAGSATPGSENIEAAAARPSVAGMQLYQLGDLLVATRDKPAYLIINAGCDLQFSPGERDCDPDQSIILIPGRLEPLYERSAETNVKRTELFELGDERFRIIWQHTRAVTLPHHKVLPEYEPQGYERKWRLKLPYALEVQQHFAAQLTRIGVPTPTPVYRELPVELYGKDANGNAHHIGTVQSGLVVFHHHQRDQFILTVDCVHKILNYMDGFIAEVESEIIERQEESAILAPPAQSSKETAPAAGAPLVEQGAKEGPPPAKDQAKEDGKKAERRRKYVEVLKETREALAQACTFQDSLHVVPETNDAVRQIDTISQTDKRTRIEIKHAASLTGRFPGNTPVVLTFLLSDFVAPLPTTTPGAKTVSPKMVDEVAATGNEERPQP